MHADEKRWRKQAVAAKRKEERLSRKVEEMERILRGPVDWAKVMAGHLNRFRDNCAFSVLKAGFLVRSEREATEGAAQRLVTPVTKFEKLY